MILFQRTLDEARRTHTGLPFEIVFSNGERQRFGATTGDPAFVLRFKTHLAFIRSMLQTTIGLGESYVSGDVVVEGDLEDAFTTLVDHGLRMRANRSKVEVWLSKAAARTLPQEKADIEHHYGRGNEFYELYLDKKLQYSCGYFKTPEDTLDQAQDQKIEHTVRKLDLRPGQRLLDIGCGWGHLMFHAAEQYGVECVGITLCDNQAKYIREQAKARKLPVDVRTVNYLELDESVKWDRIVSVGMMCHVGEKRADAFYDKLKALSAPGAVVLTHCISKMAESPGSDPFVEKHVFPGYWFFSLEGQTKRAAARGFNVLDVENLRRHYAMTAHHWRRNFLRNYAVIKQRMGFDDRFMRTWDFYLASVAGSFRAGHCNLIQMVMSNGVNDEYPLTRQFLYERERVRPLTKRTPTFPLETRADRPS
jgi:cyclopropane-fatty-acyl-phospholipid synthase